MEMHKQILGKQMFAGSCRDNGTQRGILTRILLASSLSTTPSLYCNISGDSSLPGTFF